MKRPNWATCITDKMIDWIVSCLSWVVICYDLCLLEEELNNSSSIDRLGFVKALSIEYIEKRVSRLCPFVGSSVCQPMCSRQNLRRTELRSKTSPCGLVRKSFEIDGKFRLVFPTTFAWNPPLDDCPIGVNEIPLIVISSGATKDTRGTITPP
jgi:hypothetical protein